MLIRKELDPRAPLTAAERSMLRKAAEMPPVYDEDCPPLTPEQLHRFRRAADSHTPEVPAHDR